MLFHIPIEQYETRYTADWVQQYEREFKNRGVIFETILGDRTTSVLEAGAVLDACGTNLYKMSQLTKILNMINNGKVKDGDVFFFSDLWFPGIESLFYIRNLTKIAFKIVGVLHAGTYDCWDFTSRNGMRRWGKHLERCWFNEFDMIFVATQFHKDLICRETIIINEGKIKVTGLPFYAEDLRTKYPVAEKENIIVFPHRLVEEKQPQLFEELKKMPELADYKFVYTMQETANRDEYFKLLAKSKIMISFALQETFGYSTLEAMALDNFVIVPDRLSYRETVPAMWRYGTNNEMAWLIRGIVTNDLLRSSKEYYCLDYWAKSVNRMLTEIIQGGYNV